MRPRARLQCRTASNTATCSLCMYSTTTRNPLRLTPAWQWTRQTPPTSRAPWMNALAASQCCRMSYPISSLALSCRYAVGGGEGSGRSEAFNTCVTPWRARHCEGQGLADVNGVDESSLTHMGEAKHNVSWAALACSSAATS